MHLTLKWKMLFLIGVITLCSLAGFALFIVKAAAIRNKLQAETGAHMSAAVGAQVERINTIMQALERCVDDLATSGETLYRLRKRSDADLEPEVRQLLLTTFRKTPAAIGGGLWYEPFVFDEKRRLYGPYAFRKNNVVEFTWGLSSEAYDYPSQGWYRRALPAQWNRKTPRRERIVWTAPYVDAEATQKAMVTIDALMEDDRGTIIGMATVDLSLESLKDMAAALRVTPSTVVFAVDAPSRAIVACPSSPDSLMKPATALGLGDTLGKALDLQPGAMMTQSVEVGGRKAWFYAGMTRTGTLLGLLAPDDELFAAVYDLRTSHLIISLVVVSLQLLFFVAAAFTMVRRVSAPLTALTAQAEKVAQGDLRLAGSEGTGTGPGRRRQSNDETGHLQRAFHAMTNHLSRLIGKIQESGAQVSASSTEIATSARLQETAAADQAESTKTIGGSARMISATSAELARNARDIAEAVDRTASSAESGRGGLQEMEATIGRVLETAALVSERLDEISRNTLSISATAESVNKISQQANLLSLNAAIEAEKAGASGRGFAVVAREVRRLSDHTSGAVQSVRKVVEGMNAAVHAGVMEMDKFVNEVQTAARVISDIGKRFDGILADVAGLLPRFEAVNTATEDQSRRADEIARAMERLLQLAQGTAQSLKQFQTAADSLSAAAAGMKDELSFFQVGDGRPA